MLKRKYQDSLWVLWMIWKWLAMLGIHIIHRKRTGGNGGEISSFRIFYNGIFQKWKPWTCVAEGGWKKQKKNPELKAWRQHSLTSINRQGSFLQTCLIPECLQRAKATTFWLGAQAYRNWDIWFKSNQSMKIGMLPVSRGQKSWESSKMFSLRMKNKD